MPTNVPQKKSSEAYFQFPLCALAYGGNPKERLNAITCYAVLETGETLWKSYDTFGQKLLVSSWKNDTRLPADINLERPLHQALMAGATALQVVMPRVEQIMQHHDTTRTTRPWHGRHQAAGTTPSPTHSAERQPNTARSVCGRPAHQGAVRRAHRGLPSFHRFVVRDQKNSVPQNNLAANPHTLARGTRPPQPQVSRQPARRVRGEP